MSGARETDDSAPIVEEVNRNSIRQPHDGDRSRPRGAKIDLERALHAPGPSAFCLGAGEQARRLPLGPWHVVDPEHELVVEAGVRCAVGWSGADQQRAEPARGGCAANVASHADGRARRDLQADAVPGADRHARRQNVESLVRDRRKLAAGAEEKPVAAWGHHL